MFEFTRFPLVLTLALCFAGFSPSQAADVPKIPSTQKEKDEKNIVNQYDDRYRPNEYKDAEEEPPIEGLLPLGAYSMFFVHTNTAQPGEAVLRITQPVSINGCVDLKPPLAETTISGSSMRVKVKRPELRMPKKLGVEKRTCSETTSVESDIIISRDAIIQNNIQKITFSSNSGIDTYYVKADDSSISLVPKSSNHFKAGHLPDRTDVLTYWFYPENTVVLSVPLAPKGSEDLTSQIQAVAQKNGLIDIANFVSGFQQPEPERNKLYFVDQAGTLSKSEDGRGHIVGSVQIAETFYGPEGPYQRMKQVEVIAKAPGLLE